jgi:hypothetical protein
MRLARILFIAGGILLGLGAIASVGLRLREDPLALQLIPALMLPLRRPLIGGGDFPPSLSGTGIATVYFVPGAVLVALGGWWRARTASRSHEEPPSRPDA